MTIPLENTQPADFTPELIRLLGFAAKVATAIRMCSIYAAPNIPKTAPYDVMWLSDSLHSFGQLSESLETKSVSRIVWASDSLIEAYRSYQQGAIRHSKPAADTFDRNQRYFLLDEGISIFSDIKKRALSALS